ncbi:unnamed protein product [Urochloa humidicola]
MHDVGIAVSESGLFVSELEEMLETKDLNSMQGQFAFSCKLASPGLVCPLYHVAVVMRFRIYASEGYEFKGKRRCSSRSASTSSKVL